MIDSRILILLSLFFCAQTKTMETDIIDKNLSSDSCWILSVMCHHVDSFSHNDVVSMLLVCNNMAKILTQTADVRIAYLKEEVQKTFVHYDFDFDKVTFHPLGCAAAFLMIDSVERRLHVCSAWTHSDKLFCTQTRVIHNCNESFKMKWQKRNVHAPTIPCIQITRSKLNYVSIFQPQFHKNVFWIRALRILGGDFFAESTMIINHDFIKEYIKESNNPHIGFIGSSKTFSIK